jgi:ABC-type phosphate transport system substrate-binding protein
LDYRSVGSGTGTTEFVGTLASDSSTIDVNNPASDFGSADVPLSAENYALFNGTVLQIPFQVGAVGFFHSVPADDIGAYNLNLTACVLAKIFSRAITTWDHADIVAENPNLKVPAGTKITIVHRSDGSSSTYGITHYLQDVCPLSWSLGAGTSITWPSETSSTYIIPVGGSSAMATAISSTPYSIGYLDSGHGVAEGLGEIALTNLNGKTLLSGDAEVPAAVEAYASANPSFNFDPLADWSAVKLINLAGNTTWPISAFTYIYVSLFIVSSIYPPSVSPSISSSITAIKQKQLITALGITYIYKTFTSSNCLFFRCAHQPQRHRSRPKSASWPQHSSRLVYVCAFYSLVNPFCSKLFRFLSLQFIVLLCFVLPPILSPSPFYSFHLRCALFRLVIQYIL